MKCWNKNDNNNTNGLKWQTKFCFFLKIIHFACLGLIFSFSNGWSFGCFFVSADVSCPPNTCGFPVVSYLVVSWCNDVGTAES